ncbi:MAG: AI-2E family transporter [Bacteroidetes bacterium]|jgi:predicted PurR-regulated permease PerM|nr:AI-2E family transporter [Bacteroidota bacterium]
MPNRINWRPIAGTIGFLILLIALWRFRSLVGYMLFAVALSFAGRPIVLLAQRIQIRKKTLPSSVGAALALTLIIGLALALVQLFAPLFAEQAAAIQALDPEKARLLFGRITGWLDNDLYRIDLSGSGLRNSEFLLSQIQSLVQLEGVGSVFGGLIARLGDGFVAAFSILFMAFFFLKDGALFRNIMEAITPDSMVDRVQSILTRTTHLLTRYFGGLVIQVLITTTIVALGLQIIGVEHAFLIGLLAGIFNLVPYIGPMAGAFIGLTLMATTHAGAPAEIPALLGWGLLVFVLAQLVDNFFTQPVIFANRVHAHPLEIFLVISIAGSLAGVAGMILAIPGYTLFRIVAQELFSGFKAIDRLTKNLL